MLSINFRNWPRSQSAAACNKLVAVINHAGRAAAHPSVPLGASLLALLPPASQLTLVTPEYVLLTLPLSP